MPRDRLDDNTLKMYISKGLQDQSIKMSFYKPSLILVPSPVKLGTMFQHQYLQTCRMQQLPKPRS